MRVLLALLFFWPLSTLAATVDSPAFDPAQVDPWATSDWVSDGGASDRDMTQAAPIEMHGVPQNPVGFVASPVPQALISQEPLRSHALELAMIRTSPWPRAEQRENLMDLPITFAILILVLCLMVPSGPARPR